MHMHMHMSHVHVHVHDNMWLQPGRPRLQVSVGFTMATTEAARRANGTYLLF